MNRIIKAKPLPNYRLWLKYSDGVEGEVDLSHLVGKGVFKAWQDEEFFNSIRINEETHTVEWEGGIDLCPDNLYAKIVGKDPLEVIKAGKAETEKV